MIDNGIMKTKKKNIVKKLGDGRQKSLFKPSSLLVQQSNNYDELENGFPLQDEYFQQPDKNHLFLNEIPVEKIIFNSKQKWAIILKKFMEKMDWSDFTIKYNPNGRRSIHPRVIFALIIYGITQGVSSLRKLEELSEINMVAQYLTGGYTLDHSTIGRFMNRHSQLLGLSKNELST